METKKTGSKNQSSSTIRKRRRLRGFFALLVLIAIGAYALEYLFIAGGFSTAALLMLLATRVWLYRSNSSRRLYNQRFLSIWVRFGRDPQVYKIRPGHYICAVEKGSYTTGFLWILFRKPGE